MPLAVVSRSVEPEEVVEVLLLHAQGLDALPPRLLERDGLSELVQLTLSFNRLGGEALAALAAPLPALTHLDVSHNQLTSLRGVEVCADCALSLGCACARLLQAVALSRTLSPRASATRAQPSLAARDVESDRVAHASVRRGYVLRGARRAVARREQARIARRARRRARAGRSRGPDTSRRVQPPALPTLRVAQLAPNAACGAHARARDVLLALALAHAPLEWLNGTRVTAAEARIEPAPRGAPDPHAPRASALAPVRRSAASRRFAASTDGRVALHQLRATVIQASVPATRASPPPLAARAQQRVHDRHDLTGRASSAPAPPV